MNHRYLLGELTLRSFGEVSAHPVEWIPNYGVICRSLFDSNGSLAVVAKALESRLDVEKVIPDIPDRIATLVIDGKGITLGQVETALKDAYEKARDSFLATTS